MSVSKNLYAYNIRGNTHIFHVRNVMDVNDKFCLCDHYDEE